MDMEPDTIYAWRNRIFLYNDVYISDHLPVFANFDMDGERINIMSWNINYEDQCVQDITPRGDRLRSTESSILKDFFLELNAIGNNNIILPPRSLFIDRWNQRSGQRRLNWRYHPATNDDILNAQIQYADEKYYELRHILRGITNNIDIICLQECTEQMFTELNTILGQEYRSIRGQEYCHIRGRNLNRHNQFVVFYKRVDIITLRPIYEFESKTQHLQINYNNTSKKLINAHLPGEMQQTIENLIYTLSTPDRNNSVICGDFNQLGEPITCGIYVNNEEMDNILQFQVFDTSDIPNIKLQIQNSNYRDYTDNQQNQAGGNYFEKYKKYKTKYLKLLSNINEI